MSDIRIPTLSCNTENTEPDSPLSEQLLDMTIQVLQKSKALRTPEDIKILMKCTEDNQFISNFIEKRGAQVHSELCQQFDYEYLKAGHVLFEMGSFGTTFYIILSGTVEVLIRDPTNKDPLKLNNMQVIAELTAGGSFGELAIIDSALRPRTATIKVKENCHLLVLERKEFSKILGAEEKRKLEDTVEFFAANPVFKAWSTFALKSWGYIFRMQQTYLRNAVLYREGDKAEDIYLIKSGEVVCTKVVTMHKRVKGEESLVLDDEDQVVSVAKVSTVKSVEIAIFGPGELFGEEEAYESYKVENERKLREMMPKSHTKHIPTEEELPRRETTMTVISASAEIWKIPAKLFFSKMEVNSAAKQQLISVVMAKRKRRYQRIKEIQKNSVNYMKFLQKEQKGKRDVVSSFKSTKIDAFEKNLQQEAKELSDTFFKASQKGPSEQSNHWSVGSQNSINSQDVEKKKVLLLNRSSSAKIQKKRANSLVGSSLEQTKKLIAKNQAPLAEIGELGSRSFLPNDSQDIRFEGKILENLDNENITARSSNTETKSVRKAYSQSTTQIKLRLREKLLNGHALSKNDHLYGNFLKQYNMFHPDKIIDGLKREIQPIEAEDAARRMEAAKSLGNRQVERLLRKGSAPALERVSSQPVVQVMGMDPVEINSMFKFRTKLLQSGNETQNPATERSKRMISEPTPEARRTKRISVNMKNDSPDSRNDETNSLVKKRVFVLREDNTLSCERFSKVSADKGPMARSSSVPKMDTAMNRYINNEIQRLQNSVQPDASQIRSRLFNYNLKTMYGGKPNGSKLLRALEIAKRNNSKSPDSPTRVTNLKKNVSTTQRKSLLEIMQNEFGRESPERTRNENWTAITIKRCSTARSTAEPV